MNTDAYCTAAWNQRPTARPTASAIARATATGRLAAALATGPAMASEAEEASGDKRDEHQIVVYGRAIEQVGIATSA